MIVINNADLKKVCPDCNKLYTNSYWCRECKSRLLQQDFSNWNLLTDSFGYIVIIYGMDFHVWNVWFYN